MPVLGVRRAMVRALNSCELKKFEALEARLEPNWSAAQTLVLSRMLAFARRGSADEDVGNHPRSATARGPPHRPQSGRAVIVRELLDRPAGSPPVGGAIGRTTR